MANLSVYREQFTSKGKQYNSYKVKGAITGKSYSVELQPPDKGGYKLLELVFGENTEAELIVSIDKRKDDFGKTQTKYSYGVERVDPDTGVLLRADLKPRQLSDRTLLQMLCDVASAQDSADETDGE